MRNVEKYQKLWEAIAPDLETISTGSLSGLRSRESRFER